jgi:hypothetical protein
MNRSENCMMRGSPDRLRIMADGGRVRDVRVGQAEFTV